MKYFLSILTWTCVVYSVSAHPDSLSYFQSIGKNVCQDFSYAGDDAAFVWQGLSSISSSHSLLSASVVIAGTGLAYSVDEKLRTEIQRGHTETWDNVNSVFREYGGTYSVLGSSVGLYTIGLLTESEEVRTTGRLVLEAFVVSGVVNGGLKVLIGRGRPYLNLEKDQFKPLNFLNDYNSFPSGHTTVAFTVSTVLADQIDRWWASVGLYTLAAATGVSRMYNDKHWASDVVLGASIGYLSGKLITSAHRSRVSKTSSTLRIYPSLGGIGCSYQF